ncbi:bifunctional UDP-N-acetylmuramoyl-tripeptide:D-alanyl-D-alanine ligase/alanine racemase [Roseivirga echinicomitans]
MKLSQIFDSIDGKYLSQGIDNDIAHLMTDSRKAFDLESGLFFAIDGKHHDGHSFVPELIAAGFQNFVVEREIGEIPKNTNIIKVASTRSTLQRIAALKRAKFNKPVVAITGSNGKTIIKEWLAQLLSEKLNVCKSPKSFNSQIGVPLSVWPLSETHDIGIFETGISEPGEMLPLKKVIQPTQGILTNIGSAHEQYFSSIDQKLDEKLILFEGIDQFFYRNDNALIDERLNGMKKPPKHKISWGFNPAANLQVEKMEGLHFRLKSQSEVFTLKLHSGNDSYVENIMHCVCYTYFNGWTPLEIQKGIDGLRPIKMRLELKKGINQTYIIDDTYNNDLAGLEIALDFLAQQKHYPKKSLILSDIPQSAPKENTYARVAELVQEKGITQLYAIGNELTSFKNLFPASTKFYFSTEDFLQSSFDNFEKEVVLIKGARSFGFEQIAKQLTERIHRTVLEIDLDAVTHNLNVYRQRLQPKTKLLIMVKALAYGSGGSEIAHLLQFHKVDYFGVAYVDEAVQLRKAGIKLPIMVINPSEEDLPNLVTYDIEPEIYGFSQLKVFSDFYLKKGIELKGHFTINTGMNRLGFNPEDVDALVKEIEQLPHIKVQSIYTHLAASEEVEHNDFSLQQLQTFKFCAEKMEQQLGIKTIKHALNSAGIVAFPQYQFDMVRLGIGLYGIEPSGSLQHELKSISVLKTVISQIRNVKRGETVGYGRKGKVTKNMRIATIAIGYADGFSRIFSNGNGEVMLNGQMTKVIGNVCMDMTMIDISNIEAEEGDTVIVFGEKPTISDLAKKAKTIPYEILTNVSERVKRVYFAE